jgi:hypothetical protein
MHPENFDIDGSRVYFSGMLRDSRRGVRWFDTSTRQEQEVSVISRSPGRGLAVAPGGAAILFSQLDYHNADLVMVGVQ